MSNEPEKAEVSPVEATRGGETILLVEDEDEVRRLASEILTILGYTVLDTGDPLRPRLGGASPGRDLLLISDFMMPAMRGPALAAHLLLLNSELRVLYMSGYTDGGWSERGD